MLDKEIFENFFNTRVQIVKDDDFVISGRIIGIYNNAIAFFTDGKTIYMGFERVKEIKPYGENNDINR